MGRLEELVRQQADEIRELREQLGLDEQPRPVFTGIPQAPVPPPQPRRPRYPRRVVGRLPNEQLTDENLRARFGSERAAREAYAELRVAGVPINMMAVIQRSANLFDLYVKRES